jgi:putative ABC transport system permease protein
MAMQTLWQDLRYGLRGIAQRPGFAFLAILTLGLGMGATTTIFSAIQNILLDPFPYTDAHRVAAIQIHDTTSARPGGRNFFQPREFLDFQEQNHVFDEVIGGTMEDVLLSTGEGTELLTGGLTTANTFTFLGVRPVLGRGITSDDAKAGAPPVFVMADKMWLKHYNRDPSILGQTFVLNGEPSTLVGIMPQRFTKLGADLWRPVTLVRSDPQIAQRYFMFQARLKPGVTLEQAAADVDVIARRLAQIYPSNYPKQFSVNVVSWVDSLVGQFKVTLYTLAAAVGLLLLIACSNVANMLLARATAREKEMAIRVSLGATRYRLIRQLLLESLLLAAGGAALGCLFAYGGVKAIAALIPEGMIPREAVIRLNLPVLAFSLGVAMLTTLLFGLVPALLTARRDMVEPLKDAGKGVSGGFRRGKLRGVLVVVEVALSLLLLVGAGLLMRSFVAMQRVDLGLNPENILVARTPLPRGQYSTAADKQRFFRALLERLHALPGVVAATETTTLPPYGGIGTDIQIPGQTSTEKWRAIFQLCSEGYFKTLGLRLTRGRTFSDIEVNDARKLAVVNQTLVTKFFGQEDPIGQRIKLSMLETFKEGPVPDPVFEIIGVISDAKNQGLQEPVMPEAFIPYTLTGAFERGILVRTDRNPELLLNSVRREIWAIDRGVALTMTGTLTGYLKQFSYAEPRFFLVLLGVFASVGLVLVAIGVYSVIAYTVSRQTHEIGIRMALGASRTSVLRMVTVMGLKLVGIGAAIGLLGSVALTKVIASQLWNISRFDPVTLVAVVILMAVVGLAACYFPARRAMGLDPVVALRSE